MEIKLFDGELTEQLRTFAAEKVREMNVLAGDDLDEWFQFEDKADVNIWMDSDENILRIAAYEINTCNGWVDTAVDKWQMLFEERVVGTNAFEGIFFEVNTSKKAGELAGCI